MRTALKLVIALSVLGLGLGLASITAWQLPQLQSDVSQPPGFDSPGQAMDYFVSQRVAAGEREVAGWRYVSAVRQQAKMRPATSAIRREKGGAPGWEFAGPDNVGGRTREVVFSPQDPDVVFAGGVSGGVWKSLDGGLSWRSTGGAMSNLAVMSMIFDPADLQTLYAGTGEGVYVNRPVSRSRGVRGDGIFVSRDNGASWQQLAATAGNDNFDYVNELVFDNAGRLFAATRAGVWRSDDRGVSWQQVHSVSNVEGCSDMVYSAASNRVLVSCGVHSRGAVYASSDGESWQAVIDDPNVGRTRMAVAPSDSNIIYAMSADRLDYGVRRFSRSDDGGLSWNVRFSRGNAGLIETVMLGNAIFQVDESCQNVIWAGGAGWFHNSLGVDPLNPDIVWSGGVDLFRSDDGGFSFRPAARWWVDESRPWYAHGDHHGVYFHPQFDGNSNKRMYISGDGGIFETLDARAPLGLDLCGDAATGVEWIARNSGYFVTQFYHGAVSADGSQILAGAQDNGTYLSNFGDLDSWRRIYGGDGAYSMFDPRDSQRLYVASQYANLQRSDDGGQSFVALAEDLPIDFRNSAFITPTTLDPNNPDRVWLAGHEAFRSDNRGNSWTIIGSLPAIGSDSVTTAIAVTPGDSDRVLLGFNSGHILRSDNASAAQPRFRATQPGTGNVSSITVDPTDPSRIYATYSNFGATHLLRSEDFGASWQPLDGSEDGYRLPDAPAHTLLVNPDAPQQLLLGTDIGLFVSTDGGQRWLADASGLGNVLVEHLELRQVDGGARVYAFTYGSGAFHAPLASLVAEPINPGWSGAWYDVSNPGQGFQVDANPQSGELVLTWYTYLPQSLGDTRSQNLWLIGNAALVDGQSTMTVYRVVRGQFDSDYDEAVEAIGTLTWVFVDCTSAVVSYQLNVDDQSFDGQIEVSRLTPDAACANFRQFGSGAQSKLPVQTAAGGIEYGHSGVWFEASNPGHGLQVEVLPAQQRMVIGWYAYDFAQSADDGTQPPLWLFGDGSYAGDIATVALGSINDGLFAQPSAAPLLNAGTVTFRAHSCDAASIDYQLLLAGVQRAGSIDLVRLTPPTWCADAPVQSAAGTAN